MTAEQLIIDPNRGTLPELIDAHNKLVRHLFNSGQVELQLGPVDDKPDSRFNRIDTISTTCGQTAPSLHELQEKGLICMCIAPIPTRNMPEVCHFCHKQIIEVLKSND